jgi:hypothetical protein
MKIDGPRTSGPRTSSHPDPTGRRPRRTREDLRLLLLEEGRRVLLEDGLGPNASNLTFKKVFERVEARTGVRITNASVIRRVWDNQSEYQADVLAAIAQDETRNEVGSGEDAILAALVDLDLSTPDARSRALREICRVGGNATNAAIHDSPNWPLWITVVSMATATATPEQQQRIKLALINSYKSVYQDRTTIFEAMMPVFGMRLRPPWSVEQFTVAVTAFSEGCSIRQHITEETETIHRPTGPDGEDQEWSLLSVGIEALVHQFFEPDPDFEPSSS